MTGISLYLGAENDCEYLPGRSARMAFVPPEDELDPEGYQLLVANGFRRSGRLVYRPHCVACAACRPVRLPVADFTPSRAQRRLLRLNEGLHVLRKPPVLDDVHYQLYLRYLRRRHPGTDMARMTADDYMNFLGDSGWSGTEFWELREGRDLLAVSVVDVLGDGLSAVYSFYDPDLKRRGLGTYAVLAQINAAVDLGLSWLYLGFWITECRKMAYKGGFRPLEVLTPTGWLRLDRGEAVP
ncbi:MAG: arginyltransferase [Methylococcaceae bacterium]